MSPSTSSGNVLSPASSSAEPHDGMVGPRKRKRITLACDRCRQRKARCDGALPSCQNCNNAGATCCPPDAQLDGRKRKRGARQDSAGEEASGSSTLAGQYGMPDLSFTQAQATTTDIFSMGNSTLGPVLPQESALPATSDEQTLLDLFSFDPSGAHHPTPPAHAPQVHFESNTQARVVSEPALSLQYMRPFGPTAIQPGLEQIRIAMRAPPLHSRPQSPLQGSPASLPPAHDLTPFDFSFDFGSSTHTSYPFNMPFSAHSPAAVAPLFDEGSDIPRAEVTDLLYPIFFDKLGCHFPFLSLKAMRSLDSDDPLKQVNAPLLINAVCALAARFSDSPLVRGKSQSRPPATAGLPFADKAKEILVPLLGYPSSNTVGALLLLAYYEFGMNSEGSLWMYSGMALRMAQDLGIHQDIYRYRPDVVAHQRASDNLLWWSCVVLDRTLALGTGRPVTVKDAEITAPLPTVEDVEAVASQTYSASPSQASSSMAPTSPYPHVVQLMLLYGQICEVVNQPSTTWRPAPSETSHPPSRADESDPGAVRSVQESVTPPSADVSVSLCGIEDVITAAYSALPAEMNFTSANFKRQAAVGAGPTFLHLHLWYNCILIMLYRPPLIYPRCNSASLSLADRLAVVNNSCLTIGQLLSCAEIVDEYSYLASPFVNQCFFLAASAWIQDYRIRTGRNVLASNSGEKVGGPSKTATGNSSATILAQVALQNFGLCKKALDDQARYWLGVGWISALVDKQGMKNSRTSLQAATAGVETMVSGPEMAIFRRLVHRFTRNENEAGSAPSPELNEECTRILFIVAAVGADLKVLPAMNALFAMFSQQSQEASTLLNLTPDDFALAYTVASALPDNSLRPF